MKENNGKMNFIFTFLFLGYLIISATAVDKNENKRFEVKQLAQVDSFIVNCYESPKYLIIGKETRYELGTDFLIKYKSKPDEKLSCDYNRTKNDFEIKNEWAEYYADLHEDLLFLDSSTGPGPTGLTIWDLKKRKKMFEGSWSDSEEIKNNTLTFWTETGEATEKNCPELKKWEAQGLGGAIETKVHLDLTTFKITKTNETRCSPRQ